MRRALIVALAALGTLACEQKNNGTLLVVEVTTDLGAAEIDRVEINAQPTRGKAASQSFAFSGARPAARLAVVPEGDPALDVDLTVKGTKAGKDVLVVAATVKLQPGKAITATVFLGRECLTRSCSGGQQCVAGGCAPKSAAATVQPGTGADAGAPPSDGPGVELPVEVLPPVDRRPRETSTVTGTWSVAAAPMFTGSLTSIAPVSPTEIWVVGFSQTLGFVYRGNGTDWMPVPVPGTPRPLQAVHAAASDDVWAVGFGGTILHRLGGVFASVPGALAEANFTTVFGPTPNEVIIAGQRNVMRWNGTQLERFADGIDTDVVGGFALSASDAWLVGIGGGIYRRNGRMWVRQGQNVTSKTLYAVWAAAPDDVWVTGEDVLLHYDGATWAIAPFVPAATGQLIGPTGQGIWGAADNDVWVVGRFAGRGVVAHYNGNAWASSPLPMVSPLLAIKGLPGGEIWAVGRDVILRYR